MHNFGSPADLDYMLRVAIGNDGTMHNVECIMHNFGSPADLDYMLRVAIGNGGTMHNA